MENMTYTLLENQYNKLVFTYNNNDENVLVFDDDILLDIWYIVNGGGGNGGNANIESEQSIFSLSGGGGSGGLTITNLNDKSFISGKSQGNTLKINVGNSGVQSTLELPDNSLIEAIGGNQGGNAGDTSVGKGGASVGNGSGAGANGSLTLGTMVYNGDNGFLISDNNIIYQNTGDLDSSYWYGWGGAGGNYKNQDSNNQSKFGAYGNKDSEKSNIDPLTSGANPQRIYGGGGGKGQNITSTGELGQTGEGVPGVVILYYSLHTEPEPEPEPESEPNPDPNPIIDPEPINPNQYLNFSKYDQYFGISNPTTSSTSTKEITSHSLIVTFNDMQNNNSEPNVYNGYIEIFYPSINQDESNNVNIYGPTWMTGNPSYLYYNNPISQVSKIALNPNALFQLDQYNDLIDSGAYLVFWIKGSIETSSDSEPTILYVPIIATKYSYSQTGDSSDPQYVQNTFSYWYKNNGIDYYEPWYDEPFSFDFEPNISYTFTLNRSSEPQSELSISINPPMNITEVFFSSGPGCGQSSNTPYPCTPNTMYMVYCSPDFYTLELALFSQQGNALISLPKDIEPDIEPYNTMLLEFTYNSENEPNNENIIYPISLDGEPTYDGEPQSGNSGIITPTDVN